MTGFRLVLTLLGLTLAAVALGSSSVPLAHAMTHNGSVCLSPIAFSCPVNSPVFTGQPGSMIRVNVVVQSADSFDGFSVWVGADPSVIKAVKVDLTGSVLPQASTSFQCLNDCNYWLSGGPGAVAEYAVGKPTPGPTTGLLFSIIYQIAEDSNGTSINLYFTVSPSGWVTDRVALHFTAGCDTMDCLFVPVENATFHTGDAGGTQLLQTAPLSGIFQLLRRIAITAGAIAGALCVLSVWFFARRRAKLGGKPGSFPAAWAEASIVSPLD